MVSLDPTTSRVTLIVTIPKNGETHLMQMAVGNGELSIRQTKILVDGLPKTHDLHVPKWTLTPPYMSMMIKRLVGHYFIEGSGSAIIEGVPIT